MNKDVKGVEGDGSRIESFSERGDWREYGGVFLLFGNRSGGTLQAQTREVAFSSQIIKSKKFVP